jgi:anti-sigma factor (TIGR02949 family)
MSRDDIRRCEDALRVLAEHLDRELDERTAVQVEHHLDTCRSCWSRAAFEKRLKEALAGLGREPVRPELADRVGDLIRGFATARGPE